MTTNRHSCKTCNIDHFHESKMAAVAIYEIGLLATFDLCGIHRCAIRQVGGGGGLVC